MDTSPTIDLTIHTFSAPRPAVAGAQDITATQVLAVIEALRVAIPGVEVTFSADREEAVWVLAGVIPGVDIPAIAGLLGAAQVVEVRPELPPRYVHRQGPNAVTAVIEHFLRSGVADDRHRAIRRSRAVGDVVASVGPLLDRLLRVTSTLLRWASANTTLDVGDDGAPDVVRARHAATATITRLIAHEAAMFDRWLQSDAPITLRQSVVAEADAARSVRDTGPAGRRTAERRERWIHELIIHTQMDTTEEGSR